MLKCFNGNLYVQKIPSPIGFNLYLYPGVFVPLDQLLGKDWSMLTLTPKPGCDSKSTNECVNDCTR